MTAVSGKVMSVAGKVYLSVLNSWDLNNVTINELQLHRRKQSWCTDDIWFGLNEGKPRKFSVNIADFQANTWILEPMDMKSEYTSPHMCMNVCLHIFPRGICYLKKEIFKCWEWEDGESWWQIGKNGRTLFDRPKQTVGCSANGRRRICYLSKPCPGKSNLCKLIKNVIYLHGKSMAANVPTLLARVLWSLLVNMCINQQNSMYEV